MSCAVKSEPSWNLHAFAQLEGVGEPILGDFPGLRQVALDLDVVMGPREHQQR